MRILRVATVYSPQKDKKIDLVNTIHCFVQKCSCREKNSSLPGQWQKESHRYYQNCVMFMFQWLISVQRLLKQVCSIFLWSLTFLDEISIDFARFYNNVLAWTSVCEKIRGIWWTDWFLKKIKKSTFPRLVLKLLTKV